MDISSAATPEIEQSTPDINSSLSTDPQIFNTPNSSNNVSENNPDYSDYEIKYAAGSPTLSFTNQQVVDAAIALKANIETNHNLPNTVTVNGTNVNIYTFYYLLSTVVQNLNSKNPSSVDVMSFNGPQIQKEDIRSGNMRLSELIHIADVVKVYMDRTGITPGYAYQTSLGTYMRWQTLLYTYCNVLDSYNNTKNLPASVGVKPWKILSDPNARSFTNQQVVDAAILLKDNIETNHQLPGTLLVDGINVNIYTFYYLLSTAVQNLNTKNNNPIDAMSFNGPQIQKEDIRSGNMRLSELIHIADVVKVYMDRTGITPGYAYQTSLGTYMRWQTLLYTYCNVLDNYNSTKNLPASVGVKPWKILSDPNARSFTNQQVVDAAILLKDNIETNHQLPSTVMVDGFSVNIYTFYYLLSTVVQNLNSKNNNPVDAMSFNAPQIVKEEIHTGTMSKSEYIGIADVVKVYMDRTGIVPGYAYSTSVGTYFGYRSLIYTYCNVLDSYNNTKNLPATVGVKPWKVFSVDEILDAASWVKMAVEKTHKLPDSMIISGSYVTMPSLLEMLTTTLLNINKTSAPIYLNYCGSPQVTRDEITSGEMYKDEYLKIAGDVNSYMHSSWIAPGYAYNTGVGLYCSYHNLVYSFSQILDCYNTNNYLPDYVGVKTWWGTVKFLGSTDYGKVVRIGPFGNRDSSIKIAYIIGVHPLEYVAHQALMDSIKNYDPSLKYCYYIYQVTVTRDASNYEKGRLNGQLLAKYFAVPDMLNQRYNLAVDIHNNVGNWAKTRFIFSPISGTIAETIAWNIKNRISWLSYYYPPNPTSPQYITIPLIQGGIPAVIHETYYYDSYGTVRSQEDQFVLTVDSLSY